MQPKFAYKDSPPCPPNLAENDPARIHGNGPYWDLKALQDALKQGEVEIRLTTKAEAELLSDLKWDPDELDAFFAALHAGRCVTRSSQWCREPLKQPAGKRDTRIDRLADVYLMGFNRFTSEESPNRSPKTYLKFTVAPEPVHILVYSVHYERQH